MMKISSTDQRREEKTKVKKNKGQSAVDKSKPSFDTQLTSSIQFSFEGSIEELMNDLRDQERQFLQEQSLFEMSKYKALVKKILKSIADGSFETKTLRRNRRDRADFTIIDQINHRLHEMTNAIAGSNKAFNLLKTIEEIRGLIFDLSY